MAQFHVNFLDPKGYFYPGETVAGHITVTLETQIEFRKLTLKYRGKSYCYWSEGSGDNRKSYHNNEEYFKQEVILVSSAASSETSLGPGKYTYPFNFILPTNLPPSFEAKRDTGYVRYYMKVTYDSGWKLGQSDIKANIPFNVVAAPVDLNQIPRLLEPANGSKEKFLCCLCCQSGPILLRCQINKQAFHVGEPIVFNFELDNKATNQELRTVEARLIEEVVLISMTNWKERHFRPISSVILAQGLQGGDEQSWQNVQLNTPPETIPTFDNCKCVHLTYKFLVEVDIPSAIDAKVEFPVQIVKSIQSSQPIQQPQVGFQPFGMPNALPPAGQPVYPPPVTMQPGTNWPPSQPPPPYQA